MEKDVGFTVIELLIIIAIISIIVAIAVPNLMSANIRAKVSGVKADMGSIAIALEDYKVDYGEYPKDPRFSRSTPYALDVTAEPNWPFDGEDGTDPADDNDAIGLGYLVYPKAGFEPTYLKRIAGDPFNNDGEEDWDGSSGAHNHHYLYYTGKWSDSGPVNCTSSTDSPQYWALVSYGPDKDQDITSYVNAKNAVNDGTNLYNPDNGITSSGDIIIIGP
jgi:type II secretory pathway pseudopilin PulG